MPSYRDAVMVQFLVLAVGTTVGLPHDGRHLEAAGAEGLDGEIEVYEAENRQG